MVQDVHECKAGCRFRTEGANVQNVEGLAPRYCALCRVGCCTIVSYEILVS